MVVLVLEVIVAGYAVAFGMRTVWVHLFEFKPAAKEWFNAHEAGDMQRRDEAWRREVRAHERSFDPLFFLPSHW